MKEFAKSNRRQISSFMIVGLINTAIDFFMLNILIVAADAPTIAANIISTSTALCFSFFANQRHVFRVDRQSSKSRTSLLQFIVVTLAGLYVVQTAIIYTLTNTWHLPGSIALSIRDLIGLQTTLGDSFVTTNTAKGIATAASMVWNFIWYKKVVFRDNSEMTKNENKKSNVDTA